MYEDLSKTEPLNPHLYDNCMDGYTLLEKPISWTDLSNQEFTEAKWLIEKLVPTEGFVLLSSIAGEKKSWLALEMARSVALGEPFTRDELFKTNQGNVLYVNAEMSKREIQRRGKQLGLKETDAGKIFFLNQLDLNLNEEEISQEFITYLEDNKIALVIIDTFRPVAGGIKEEKAEEIRRFYDRFRSLKDKGISMVFLDHCRKPTFHEGKKPQKEQVLGSQDKVASVEVLLMIQSDRDTGKINVYQHKNRLDKEINPFSILMEDEEDDDGRVTTTLTYCGEIDDDETKKETAKDTILNLLEKRDFTQQELIEINQAENDVGNKNTRTALKELVADKLIIKGKTGRHNSYRLPVKGEEITNDFSF